MSVIQISLGTSIFGNTSYPIPFWFTGDSTIHLSTNKPTEKIELKNLSKINLEQIKSGIKNKELICSAQDAKLLDEQIATFSSAVVKNTPVIKEDKNPGTKDELKKIQNDSLLEEGRKLLEQSANKLLAVIGGNQIDDGIIEAGISDLELLGAMKQVELGKLKPRKPVLNLLEKRITALESIGISVKEELMEITEEEVATIVIDHDNQTISPVEQEVTEKE